MEKNRIGKLLAPLIIIVGLLYGLNTFKTSVKEEKTQENNVIISFLDVGQGDSILIKTPWDNYLLVDGGPDQQILQELGGELSPLNKDIKSIFVSHPHADHITGINYLFDRYRINTIYLTGFYNTSPEYIELINNIKEKEVIGRKMLKGDIYNEGEVSIKSIWPPPDITYKDLNETSMVLLLTYKENKVLLLGDIPEEEQEKIINEENIGDIQLLKVSHHGSKYGVSENLLNLTKPEYAVIQVGKNSFGHPAQSSLSKLHNQLIFRTDKNGTIDFILDGKDIHPF